MQKQEKKRKLLWLVLAAVAVAAILIVWHFFNTGGNQDSQASSGIVIAEDAEEWDGEMEDLSGEEQEIKIPGYGEITIPADDDTWYITLANPEGNNCYFQYSITIDDSETPIYESDLIEPGKAITEFQVSEVPDAGEYTIHLNISTYSMDGEFTPMNGADVKAVLHVE